MEGPQNPSTLNGSTHNSSLPAPIAAQVDKVNETISKVKEEIDHNFIADSHDLALREPKIQGAIQKQSLGESGLKVNDLGWHKDPSDMPDGLIGGVSNDSLFAMIRRFNKDVFDVKAVPSRELSGLDLVEAWDDDHATDKITLHLQRAYLSIVLGLASFGKQMSRLRSWKETRRTSAFCLAYLLAWALDLLMPLVLGTLVVIIASEKARDTLFPPAPLALVNIATGGLQKPQAGQLGTSDTITGAPEKAAGEAKDEEAANFVDNIRHIIARAVGMHDNQDKEGDPLEGKVPKPVRKAIKSVKEAGAAPGHATDEPGKDMTQKPMEEILWEKAQPQVIEPAVKMAPHVIGEIVDNWERVANAISPSPPFSQLSFLRIDGILGVLFLTSLFVPQYLVYKGTGFAIGFGLFGDPIISRGLELLNAKFPAWMEMLEPKNNILRGVPTNNQLTLTLLRIGEAHHSPIPPIRTTKKSDANNIPQVDVNQMPFDASNREVRQAIEPSAVPNGESPSSTTSSSSNPNTPTSSSNEEEKPKHRHLSKIIGVFKGNTKATVETKLAVDHVRAAAGSEKAKGHLGVLPKKKNIIYAGPSEFAARFEGKKGWLYITTSTLSATGQRLIFTNEDPRHKDLGVEGQGLENRKGNVVWEMEIDDIKRLKRATAFMHKAAEAAADWSEETELLGSIEIDDVRDKTWRFTAVPERDELFNRLVAVGRQKWVNM